MSSLVERLLAIAPEDRPAMISCRDSTTREMNATIREAANEIERARQALCDARDAMGRAADMMENGLPEVRRNGADLLRRDMDDVRAAIARLQ